jgi:uncharacterized protein involved in outer membrane biogenesis
MDTTVAAPKDVTDTKPVVGFFDSRTWRTIRNILLGVLVAVFVIWLVLFITKGRFLKRPFESVATRMAGRDVKVGKDFQLYFAPLKIKFYAEGLSIANPRWATKPNLFQAQKIDMRVSPLSLLFGKRRVYWLDLTGGSADLEWNVGHTANTWTFADTGGKPFELPRIDRATMVGTKVRYIDPKMRLLADLGIDPIAATNKTIGKAVELRGTGQIRDTPFRLVAQLMSPDATLDRGENKLVARAWAAGNVIDVAGTLPSATDIEDVPLRMRARGRNLADLLGIIGVVLPNTRDYGLRGQLVKDGREYRFTHMAGHFGDTDLAGRLTIFNGERLRLDSALATRQLDIVDAAPFIGYNPDIVAAKGAVAAAAATGAAPQRVLPDAALPVAGLQRFDAGLHWTIQDIKSRNVPISHVDLTLALDRGRLALSPLSFAMARGNVAADLIFDTRSRPALDSYDVRLSPTPMGRLLAGYGVDESGTTGTIKGRIQLKGRGDTIHDSLATATGRAAFIMPRGSFWTRNAQLSELDIGTFIQKMFEHKLKEPVQINCGLIAFTVHDGIAAADPIIVDTKKNVILGRGGLSFKNESIDLAFRADGKQFSLFSAQSPVGLNGYFAKPSIQVISPELLARAGGGVGLGAVASPLAAILAFIDVGDAKSAACGPILAGAHAQAMRTTKGKPRDDVGNGTTAKSESGKESTADRKKQKKKFLGIF